MAATTLAKWDTVFDRYFRGPLGSYPLAKISRQDVRDTISAVPSPWQAGEALKLLRMLLYRAVDDNRLRFNAAARVEAPGTKRKPIRVLNPRS